MIKINMKMPKSCIDCPFLVKCENPEHPYISCKITNHTASIWTLLSHSVGRPIDCPLKSAGIPIFVYKDSLDGKIKPVGGTTKQDCYNYLYQLQQEMFEGEMK